MRILITGASGLLGGALSQHWLIAGHEVLTLSRGESAGKNWWDPESGEVSISAPEAIDAVVHLSGENVADGRWTEAKKQRLIQSRVRTTRLISEYFAGQETKPAVMIVASGISYYGDTGDQLVDESAASGGMFLSEVCREWESAADPARESGIRVIHARLGMVLSSDGGALAKMLPAFRVGGGGVLGSGCQWMSWVSLEDVVGIFAMMLSANHLEGVVNVVAPEPVTNRQFTKALGQVLKRPTVLPMPAFLVRILFGEMGEELLLASSRVTPAQVNALGYRYRHPSLEACLKEIV